MLFEYQSDDFHNVKEVRYKRGRYSPKGFWLDSYNYQQFVTEVIEPFNAGPPATFLRVGHDLKTDEIFNGPRLPIPPQSILVVDGIFLHREELVSHWNCSVFLDVDFAISIPRMALRDGGNSDFFDQLNQRYMGGQRIYLETSNPYAKASLVIDNNNFDYPIIKTVR